MSTGSALHHELGLDEVQRRGHEGHEAPRHGRGQQLLALRNAAHTGLLAGVLLVEVVPPDEGLDVLVDPQLQNRVRKIPD
eukprot:CAMPEP_0170131954 /NCGR_PEP_ID=MMETSP0020_2-20130122/23577_1 /TAXON_ID=98059 /ORGANISM="Dinobryon sp., Strain UTEXLB2267" /LENGTH=79 /DNA_ID=CAMNT_0010367171 /DNA_START=225 /DNA_END=464 /DNA_ORIENTATION=-